MFINNLMGTSSKIKILRTLTEFNTAFTLKELENETLLSRGIVHRETTRLAKDNFIFEIKTVGKEKAYRINMENPYTQKAVELFSIEKIRDRKNSVILKIWNALESIVSYVLVKKLEVISIMLFGSHARGMATPRSDIDILIVTISDYENVQNKLTPIFEKYEKKLMAKINPVYMTRERYLKEQTEKTNFIIEINKGNILLFGGMEKHDETSNKGLKRGLRKGLGMDYD